jgi:serine/threonine-protein kinase RsbW
VIPEICAKSADYRGVGWENSPHVRAEQKTRPKVRFCLVFERELLSVPVMRRVLGDTLRGIGLNEESVDDILLAATEACTNVILHAGQSAPAYMVAATVDGAACRVEVTDDGEGCPEHREAAVAALAESGRGFAIMEACVDAVTLRSAPGQGTQVVLDKRVSWPGQLV